MGAWGTRPDENDGAHDMYADVMAPSFRKLGALFRKKRVDTYDRWSRLGVLLLVMGDSTAYIDEDVTDQALEDIEVIRADKEWFESWRDPQAVRRSLTNLKKRLSPPARRRPTKKRRRSKRR